METESQTLQRPKRKASTAPGPVEQAPTLEPGSEAPADRTPKWEFTFEEDVRDPDRDPEKIVLRELTQDQMEMSNQLSRGDKKRSGAEAVKESLYSVDGRRVDHGEFEADVYWAKWSSPVRLQALHAWAEIHTTSKEQDTRFLATRQRVR